MICRCERFIKSIKRTYNSLFNKNIKLAFIGMQGTEKASLLRNFNNAPLPKNKDTSVIKLHTKQKDTYMSIYNIPEADELRDTWDYYYNKAEAILFFVKANMTPEENEEAKNELHSLLFRNAWNKKPLLVVATGNEKEKSMTCKELIITLNLMTITDRQLGCFSISVKENDNIDTISRWVSEVAGMLKNKKK